jgi:RNA polymerase sigma-70 factor (ECF subfamily)
MSNYCKHTDNELVNLLQDGDHASFTEIYDRYWKPLYNAAYQACRSREDSLDICQAIFVWIWDNRSIITIPTTLKGYLFTAVKYKVANFIRNGKVRQGFFENLASTDTQVYEENDLEIRELEIFIAQLINELPPRCREVFMMSRNEQLSHGEIATQLGIAERTVDEQIHRALKKLKTPLTKLATIFLLF